MEAAADKRFCDCDLPEGPVGRLLQGARHAQTPRHHGRDSLCPPSGTER
jgi:hypothetical protein